MHFLWQHRELALAFTVVFWIGWVRGAYVMMRCKDGDCLVPTCKNHKS